MEDDIGAGMEGSRTDDNVVAREEEAIKLDGLNVAQVGWLVGWYSTVHTAPLYYYRVHTYISYMVYGAGL